MFVIVKRHSRHLYSARSSNANNQRSLKFEHKFKNVFWHIVSVSPFVSKNADLEYYNLQRQTKYVSWSFRLLLMAMMMMLPNGWPTWEREGVVLNNSTTIMTTELHGLNKDADDYMYVERDPLKVRDCQSLT